MTSARLLSDLLMLCASFRRCASLAEPLAARRSEPARSTRLSVACVVAVASGRVHSPCTRNAKIEWLRLERSFIRVAATWRRFCARPRSAYTSSGFARGSTAACSTCVCVGVCLISQRRDASLSRSDTWSRYTSTIWASKVYDQPCVRCFSAVRHSMCIARGIRPASLSKAWAACCQSMPAPPSSVCVLPDPVCP